VSLGVYDLAHFGQYFGVEETATRVIDKNLHLAWMPGERFQKVPSEQVMAFVNLCVACLQYKAEGSVSSPKKKKKGQRSTWIQKDGVLVERPSLGVLDIFEVAAGLYRHHETGEVRFFIERQAISAATVESRSGDTIYPPIDLLSGEVMVEWWNHWHEYGRFHSHNTMEPLPSKTDDDSELKTPGVYVILGKFAPSSATVAGHTFVPYTSVVTPYPETKNNIRRDTVAEQEEGALAVRPMLWDDVVVWDPTSTAVPHPDVWKNISTELPAAWLSKKKALKKPRVWKDALELAPSVGGSWWDDERSLDGFSDSSRLGYKGAGFDDIIDNVLAKRGLTGWDGHVTRMALRDVLSGMDCVLCDMTYDEGVEVLDEAMTNAFTLGLKR